MSGTLSPGTRIPEAEPNFFEALDLQLRPFTRAYYRGLVEGGVLGIIMGSIVTACALALAWSHLG